MIKCPKCGKQHSLEFHVEQRLEKRGFPTDSKNYKSAHKEADVKEKAKYPKGYEKMKKVDDKLAKKELAGKNTKTGKIDVSKKVPKSLRKEVAFHEKTENKILRKVKKK